jgi:hypothetical protein
MVTRLREFRARRGSTHGSLIAVRGLTIGIREIRQIRRRAYNAALAHQMRLVSGMLKDGFSNVQQVQHLFRLLGHGSAPLLIMPKKQSKIAGIKR